MGLWAAAAALFLTPSVALGQAQPAPVPPGFAGRLGTWLAEATVFGVVGIVLLIGAYYVWEAITPYSVRDALTREKNLAVAVVVAAFIIGTAIVIASAISP